MMRLNEDEGEGTGFMGGKGEGNKVQMNKLKWASLVYFRFKQRNQIDRLIKVIEEQYILKSPRKMAQRGNFVKDE